jgi:hypothetical protein
MDPTFAGFKQWVQTLMGVPVDQIPNDDTLQAAYDEALNLAYYLLAAIPSQPTSPSIYALAVYNLAGSILMEIAVDNPNSTFWEDLRNKFGINSFTPGLINSAHDQHTGEGMVIPPSLLNGLTLFNLQLLKTPWGRRYLMFAGQWGTIWGLTG